MLDPTRNPPGSGIPTPGGAPAAPDRRPDSRSADRFHALLGGDGTPNQRPAGANAAPNSSPLAGGTGSDAPPAGDGADLPTLASQLRELIRSLRQTGGKAAAPASAAGEGSAANAPAGASLQELKAMLGELIGAVRQLIEALRREQPAPASGGGGASAPAGGGTGAGQPNAAPAGGSRPNSAPPGAGGGGPVGASPAADGGLGNLAAGGSLASILRLLEQILKIIQEIIARIGERNGRDQSTGRGAGQDTGPASTTATGAGAPANSAPQTPHPDKGGDRLSPSMAQLLEKILSVLTRLEQKLAADGGKSCDGKEHDEGGARRATRGKDDGEDDGPGEHGKGSGWTPPGLAKGHPVFVTRAELEGK